MSKFKKHFLIFWLLPSIWFFLSLFPAKNSFTYLCFLIFLLNIFYIAFSSPTFLPIAFWGAILDVYKGNLLGIYLSGFLCLRWWGFKIKEKIIWLKISTQTIFVFIGMLFLKGWQYIWSLIFELNLQETFKEIIILIFTTTLLAPIVFKVYDILFSDAS